VALNRYECDSIGGMSIRSIVMELRGVLDLEEGKAMPVGTVSTYKDGSKWKKMKSGKWVPVGGKAKSKSANKPILTNKSKTKTKSAPAKHKLKFFAKKPEKKKNHKLWLDGPAKGPGPNEPAWYKETPKILATESIYKKKGFSQDEAVYAATSMDAWVNASVSSGAAHMRGAMSAIVGRSLDEEKEAVGGAMTTYKGEAEFPDAEKWVENGYKGNAPPNPETAKAALTKLANISQGAYKSKTVVLYRGVEDDQYNDAIKSGKLKVGALSSWSEDPKVARSFSGIDDHKGGVLRIEVPREQIAMSYRACPNLLKGEKEVVLAAKGAVNIQPYKIESLEKGKYVTVELEDGVVLRVSDESEVGAADGYSDWMRQFR
jgi:hypothetical protein